MKTNRRKRNMAGFSLAEMLAAVLILLLASAIVAAGMPMAREAYEKAVDAANAQTLLSTTVTMLRSELSRASDVVTATEAVGEGGADVAGVLQSFRSGRTCAKTTLSSSETGIQITDYAELVSPTPRYLVTSEAATKTLHTQFSYITYNAGVFTVHGLEVVRGGKTIAELSTLDVRTINS